MWVRPKEDLYRLDVSNYSTIVDKNKIYKVIAEFEYSYKIIDDTGNPIVLNKEYFTIEWSDYMCVKIPEPMKGLEVMCVNNKFHGEQLTIGKKYYVMKDGILGDSVYIEADDGRIWEMRRDRFVYVDHNNDVILR